MATAHADPQFQKLMKGMQALGDQPPIGDDERKESGLEFLSSPSDRYRTVDIPDSRHHFRFISTGTSDATLSGGGRLFTTETKGASMPIVTQIAIVMSMLMAGLSGWWWATHDVPQNKHQEQMMGMQLDLARERTAQEEQRTKQMREARLSGRTLPIPSTQAAAPVPQEKFWDITNVTRPVLPVKARIVVNGAREITLLDSAEKIKTWDGEFMLVDTRTGEMAWTPGYRADPSPVSVQDFLRKIQPWPAGSEIKLITINGAEFRT